jgi:hypothetical protein
VVEAETSSVPRYFFSVNDGTMEQTDTVGTVLSDAKAVRSEAIRTAGEMLADVDGALRGQEWRMIVTDANGKVVLRLQFSAIEEAS